MGDGHGVSFWFELVYCTGTWLCYKNYHIALAIEITRKKSPCGRDSDDSYPPFG